jgi:hypothetical protein
MAVSSGPELRSSVVLGLVLGVAVLVGVVAVLLGGTLPTGSQASHGQLTINLPPSVWGLLFLSPLVAGFAAILIQRVRNGASRVSGRILALFVVAVVLALLFVVVFVGGGGGNQGTVTVAPKGPPPPPHNGTNNSSGGVGGSGTAAAPVFSITLSPWVLLAIVLGVGASVGALAVPGVLARIVDRPARSERGGPTTPAARDELHAALAEAGAALGRGDDPRTTIVRLYVRLLAEFAPRIGDVASLTAEEIHRRVLVVLGVGERASEALTRLFEEARYSSHPIGPEDAGRCRTAIEEVERDLARSVAA